MASTSPWCTSWPSVKFTFCRVPVIWLRIETVFEADTVPSPSRKIGTVRLAASAIVTGTAGAWRAAVCGAGRTFQ